MRLYYLPCPQHFHNHSFNEVNLFKTVDKGITVFFPSLPLPVCVSISMLPLLTSFRLSLTWGGVGGEEVFHIHSLPLSSPMSPGSHALLLNQTA